MKPELAGARRPLALLTLAVLAAHLLVLAQPVARQPSRPPAVRTLVTRVLAIEPAAPMRTPTPEAPAKPIRPAPAAARTTVRPAAPLPAPAPAAASVPATNPEATPATLPIPAPAEPAAATAPSASAAPVLAFVIPGSVRLRYAVSGQSRGQVWNLDGELLWRHDGGHYEAKLEYSSPFLPLRSRSRSQQSTGRLTAEGLTPNRFSDKGRSEQATHFERDRGRLVFSSNAPEAPLLPGAQDRLSVFLQLAAMIAADPGKYPEGSTITLQTAGTRDAEPWLFTLMGEETLALPGGSVATVKLTRNPRREYDIRVELWLGLGMDYMPARIRLTQPNGDFVDQQWSSTDRP